MKFVVTLVAAAALFVPGLVHPVSSQAKVLPPAFGKELVPDAQSNQRNESKAAEIEEKEERHERAVEAPTRRRGARGKIHIELDGDEDGGGDDVEDGGGEF